MKNIEQYFAFLYLIGRKSREKQKTWRERELDEWPYWNPTSYIVLDLCLVTVPFQA